MWGMCIPVNVALSPGVFKSSQKRSSPPGSVIVFPPATPSKVGPGVTF